MTPRKKAEPEAFRIPWGAVSTIIALLATAAGLYAKLMVLESKVDLLYKIQYEQGAFGPRNQVTP